MIRFGLCAKIVVATDLGDHGDIPLKFFSRVRANRKVHGSLVAFGPDLFDHPYLLQPCQPAPDGRSGRKFKRIKHLVIERIPLLLMEADFGCQVEIFHGCQERQIALLVVPNSLEKKKSIHVHAGNIGLAATNAAIVGIAAQRKILAGDAASNEHYGFVALTITKAHQPAHTTFGVRKLNATLDTIFWP